SSCRSLDAGIQHVNDTIFPGPPACHQVSCQLSGPARTARDDDSSSLVKLSRRGLALALVRAPCDHRVPADEEDLADFEIDVGARADMQDRRCGESGPLARPASYRPGAAESQPDAVSTRTSASDRRRL